MEIQVLELTKKKPRVLEKDAGFLRRKGE